MNWNQILCDEREKDKKNHLSRYGISEFEKDYFEIVTSSSFRRLQDKTQVYSMAKDDFSRTRLTHSMEVSTIAGMLGETIWNRLKETGVGAQYPAFGFDFNEQRDSVVMILRCVALLHDIGNPPLGHAGEDAIRDWFNEYLAKEENRDLVTEWMKNDLIHFEGNAQALRIITKIHHARNVHHGMNLTYGVINALIKYPISANEITPEKKKYGYMYSERDFFKTLTEKTGVGSMRNPLVYVLEAADDIAYRFADMEDAAKNGLVSFDELLSAFDKLTENPFLTEKTPAQILRFDGYESADEEKKYAAMEGVLSSLRIAAINYATDSFVEHYKEIMEGCFSEDLIHCSRPDNPKSIAWHQVFTFLEELISNEVYKVKDAMLSSRIYKKILMGYLDIFVPEALKYTPNGEDTIPQIPSHLKNLYGSLCADNPNLTEQEKKYYRMLMITDYISGMTDRYAFKNLAGI